MASGEIICQSTSANSMPVFLSLGEISASLDLLSAMLNEIVRYWMGSMFPGSIVRLLESEVIEMESESRRASRSARGPVSTSSAYWIRPVSLGASSDWSMARGWVSTPDRLKKREERFELKDRGD